MDHGLTPLLPLHISVPKTARYYVIGEAVATVRDIWVVCHGYGQLASSFAEPFRKLISSERLIVVPEALSRFYLNTDPPHTTESQIGAVWMTREDRESEIGDIVSYLDALIEQMFELLGTHGVEREQVRVHALGFSQGAPAVARWGARGATRVGHLVLWGTGLPQDVNIRSMRERVEGLRVDLVYGKQDRFVTGDAVAAQEAVLAGSGVPYRVMTFEGGHTLNSALLRELLEEG